AFVVIIGTNFLFPRLELSSTRAMHLGISLTVHLALVATQLRLFTPPRAFLVAAAAVLLANLVSVALVESLATAVTQESTDKPLRVSSTTDSPANQGWTFHPRPSSALKSHFLTWSSSTAPSRTMPKTTSCVLLSTPVRF